MAKSDRDLFERLRSAGLRKQVARTLSGIGDDAGKKATRAARGAVAELRSLADEIERRLPGESARGARRRGASSTATRPRRAGRGGTAARSSRPRGSASSTASRQARGSGSRASGSQTTGSQTTGSRASGAAQPAPSTSGRTGGTRSTAPRGQNKARILQALKAGPKTAADIARETGIATGTASTTLNKLARSGEVVKAPRGYALPGGPGVPGGSGGAAA